MALTNVAPLRPPTWASTSDRSDGASSSGTSPDRTTTAPSKSAGRAWTATSTARPGAGDVVLVDDDGVGCALDHLGRDALALVAHDDGDVLGLERRRVRSTWE